MVKKLELRMTKKPLETIIRKPLQNSSPKILLMLLGLLRYKLNLKYVPGIKVCIADMLSPDEEMELRIHSLVSELPITREKSTC